MSHQNIATSRERKHFPTLDLVRGMSILFIIVYHYMQGFFGPAFLIVPEGFAANFSRLQIFKEGGFFALLKNIFTGFFAYGFATVNVFLVLSGFVLAWGALHKKPNEKKPASKQLSQISADLRESWLFKRLKRILVPLYISLFIGALLLTFRNFAFPQLSWWPNYSFFDFVKFLLPPFFFFDIHWLQQMDGAYWYVTLILQLYLIFPLLFWLMKKFGVPKFLLITFLLTITYRFLATYGYNLLLPYIKISYLDTAPMGVIVPAQNGYEGFCFFLPRLFEFSFGMALASLEDKKGDLLEKLTGASKFLLFLLILLGGFSLNYFRAGWIFSDAVIGVGFFGLLLNIALWIQQFRFLEKFLKFVSKSSYELYLLHGYFLGFVLLPLLATWGLKNETGFWIFLPIFFVLATLLGYFGFLVTNLSLRAAAKQSR